MDSRLPSASRISRQPVMAWGLDGTELIFVIGAGFATTAASALAVGLTSGRLNWGLAAGSLLGAAAGACLRALIVVGKRQKPDGYYRQLLVTQARAVLGAGPGIRRGGGWDVLRHGEES